MELHLPVLSNLVSDPVRAAVQRPNMCSCGFKVSRCFGGPHEKDGKKKIRSPRTKPLSANTDANRGNWAAIGKCIPQKFLHITRGHQGNPIHNCIARWMV